MILKIHHKGLRQLYEKDMAKGVTPNHVKRLKAILARMEISTCPDDMDLPGLRLHKLSGDLAEFYSVDVSANWRIIFRFENKDITDVDLIDYH